MYIPSKFNKIKYHTSNSSTNLMIDQSVLKMNTILDIYFGNDFGPVVLYSPETNDHVVYYDGVYKVNSLKWNSNNELLPVEKLKSDKSDIYINLNPYTNRPKIDLPGFLPISQQIELYINGYALNNFSSLTWSELVGILILEMSEGTDYYITLDENLTHFYHIQLGFYYTITQNIILHFICK